MSWIDDLNKKLEEQRAAYKESIESGEVDTRVSQFTGGLGLKTLIENNPNHQSHAGKKSRENPSIGQTEASKKNIKKAQEVAKKSEKRLDAAKVNIKKGREKGQIAIADKSEKRILHILSLLNSEFTRKEAVELAIQNNLSSAWVTTYIISKGQKNGLIIKTGWQTFKKI